MIQYSTVYNCNYSLALKPLAAWTGELLLLLLHQRAREGFTQDLLKCRLDAHFGNQISPF